MQSTIIYYVKFEIRPTYAKHTQSYNLQLLPTDLYTLNRKQTPAIVVPPGGHLALLKKIAVTSYEVQWYPFLVSMDTGGPYLYTGSKYRGIRRSVCKIQGGGCKLTTPLFGRHVTKKYLRRTRVKSWFVSINIKLITF